MTIKLELHRQRRRIWESTGSPTEELSATLPFELDLTADLPHCIHLQQSSLSYTLEASVQTSNPEAGSFTVAAPVHLVRYGAASFTDFNTSPCRKALTHPTKVELSIPKSRFRKSEPIPLRVRIPPPETTLVADKGLHLRSVSAELVRTINSSLPSSTSTVLCRTGKSARFSSGRPLSLRLTLPPRLEDEVGCEAITQTTIFHSIAFFIRLTVTITGRDPSDRQDFVLNTPVGIMPDQYRTRASEKQREAVQESLEIEYLESVPTYHESEGPSSSRRPEYIRTAATEAGWSYDSDEEPEYDGYEESSALEADAMAHPPPAISEDVSPPVLSPDQHRATQVVRTFAEPVSLSTAAAAAEGAPFILGTVSAPQRLPLPPSPELRPAGGMPGSNTNVDLEGNPLLSDDSTSSDDSHAEAAAARVEAEAPPPSYRDDGSNGTDNLMLPLMMHVSNAPSAGPPPYSL